MDAPAKAVLTEVVKILVQHVGEIANFRSALHFHRSTLLRIQPMFDEIDRLNRSLNRPTQETKMFTDLLREGKEIDQNCSTINSFNIGGKLIQSRKLRKWYESLVKFLETEGLLRDIKKVMLDNGRKSGSSGSCGVPDLPDGIVAFDEPLRELKDILLLNDKVPAVVISAPGGCGKTTLAKLLCHDDEIKGIPYRCSSSCVF